MEEWKDVKGYEGKYQVSNLGNVRSLNYRNTGEIRILKPRKNKEGYFDVKLSDEHRGVKTYRVHRLVAEAFIPNPNNHPCVNHIDETRDNNNLDNLEWCTFKHNSNHGTLPQRLRKKNCKKIRCVNTGEIFDGTKEAGEWANVHFSAISKVTTGVHRTAGKHPQTGEPLKWELIEMEV